MPETLDLLKGENKVRIVGGKLRDDFYTLKRDIDNVNSHYFTLLYILGLSDDTNLVFETLNNGFRNLCSVFIEKAITDMKAGKIPKNKFLSEQMVKKIEKQSLPEQETTWNREVRRSLKAIYKEIVAKYRADYGIYYFEPILARNAFKIFRKALFVNEDRKSLGIDVNKYLEIYKSYMIAEESGTKILHEQAAEAVNKFFNGVEITQRELSKYFIIEDGIVKIQPTSINPSDYSRLGKRTFGKAIITNNSTDGEII